MVTLTADEVQRYKRHLVLRDVGAPGQRDHQCLYTGCPGARGSAGYAWRTSGGYS